MTLLYNGQEAECLSRPSLFDKDGIDWGAGDISPLLKRLYRIKQSPILADSAYCVRDAGNGILIAEHRAGERRMLGVFSTLGGAAVVSVDWPDGWHKNLIDDGMVRVEGGLMPCEGEPVILSLDARA